MSSDVILQPREEIEPPSTRAEDDPRRAGSVVVSLRSDGNCTLTVDGESGAPSSGRKSKAPGASRMPKGAAYATASIRGKAASREEAVALAEHMVRDGTMPTPVRKLAACIVSGSGGNARNAPSSRPRSARRKSARRRPPLDGELQGRPGREPGDTVLRDLRRELRSRRSGSVAVQLIREYGARAGLVEVRSAIAHLEYEIAHACRPRKRWGSRTRIRKATSADPEHVRKLARAREILALIDDGSGWPPAAMTTPARSARSLPTAVCGSPTRLRSPRRRPTSGSSS